MGLDVLAIQGDLIPYQKEIDSLKKDYSLQKDPLKKAKTVYELSFFYSYSDSSQSKAYLEQGLQLSKNSDLWLAIGKVYEGAFYMVSLEDLCKSLQNSNTQIELQLYGELNSLSHDKQTHIYRIVQELLNNSLKHAHPQHILVQCSLEEHAILITVEDDGAGFDVDLMEKEENEGSGLKNVKTRINYLHGSMDVQSKPGKGTTINIELPFKHSGKPKAN